MPPTFKQIAIYRDGRLLRKGTTLGVVVFYAKYRSDLMMFDVCEMRSADLFGFRFECTFADGAKCIFVSRGWRGPVAFFAKGARRANGPFPATLRISSTTPAYIRNEFNTRRDLHKSSQVAGAGE